MLNSAQDKIRLAVSQWDGVVVRPHRFGGIEFRLGRRELGHLHGDSLADLPFPMNVRDELVSQGLARPHHILPQSGWVSVPLKTEEDVVKVIALFRRSWELACRSRPKAAGASESSEEGGSERR